LKTVEFLHMEGYFHTKLLHQNSYQGDLLQKSFTKEQYRSKRRKEQDEPVDILFDLCVRL